MAMSLPFGRQTLHWFMALLGLAAGCNLKDLTPDWEGISGVCCESTSSADCTQGFPALCSRDCAAVISPFWDDCNSIIKAFGDIFPADEKLLGDFADGPCHQVPPALSRKL